MNRAMIVAIVLAVALVAPVSARNFYRMNAPNPKVGAGQINADGSIARGSGFVTRHVRTGKYEIEFSPGYFSGCAAMAVESVGGRYAELISTVNQHNCGPTFRVTLTLPGTTANVDHDFEFIAVEEQ